MTLARYVLEVLHVLGKHQSPQAHEVAVALVFDVDCAPGVTPPPHFFSYKLKISLSV